MKKRPDASAVVAELKGDIRMVELLATAVGMRQRLPEEPFDTWWQPAPAYRDRPPARILLRGGTSGDPQLRSRRHPSPHPRRAERRGLSTRLRCAGRHRRRTQAHPHLHVFMERHWPVLSPEQALNDLFGSSAMSRLAATKAASRRRRSCGRERVAEAESGGGSGSMPTSRSSTSCSTSSAT